MKRVVANGATKLRKSETVIWSEALLLAAGVLVVRIAYFRMCKLKSEIVASAQIDVISTATDTLLLLLIGALLALLAVFGFHVN